MTEALGKCGDYTLLRRLGAGGMGEIFLAEGPGGDRVAIKRLLPQCADDPLFVGMFLDEARLVERLEHPNIGRVFTHGMDAENHYFLVMEHIDGRSLREVLEDRAFKGLSFPIAARIIADVAAGLDHAHRTHGDDDLPLGLVHRDVSPANIMIGYDGSVRIVDFGLAKARTQMMKTQPGLVKGKFGYLAPEQLGGQVDWRTDLFALGLCFYEALHGHPLFDQQTAAETVHAIRAFRGPPPIAAQVAGAPPSLETVLGKVLAFEADDRYQSAGEFRAALATVVLESGLEHVRSQQVAALLSRGSVPSESSGRTVPGLSISPAAIWLAAGVVGFFLITFAIWLAAS